MKDDLKVFIKVKIEEFKVEIVEIEALEAMIVKIKAFEDLLARVEWRNSDQAHYLSQLF